MKYCDKYNDKSSVFSRRQYNCMHVHMCIIILNNKVIYDNEISLSHRQASVYVNCLSYVVQTSLEHIQTKADLYISS